MKTPKARFVTLSSILAVTVVIVLMFGWLDVVHTGESVSLHVGQATLFEVWLANNNEGIAYPISITLMVCFIVLVGFLAGRVAKSRKRTKSKP